MLEVILKQIFKHGTVLDPFWYYQNLKVEPVGRQNDHLVFKTQIPILDPNVYTLYQFTPYPFPIQDSWAIHTIMTGLGIILTLIIWSGSQIALAGHQCVPLNFGLMICSVKKYLSPIMNRITD